MIKLIFLINILVKNVKTAFNCQDEIPVDEKYGYYHKCYWYLYPNIVLKSQADENFISILSSEYVGHQGR